MKISDATNNLAEFAGLEEAMKDAVQSKHSTVLFVTDSQLVLDFLIGANSFSSASERHCGQAKALNQTN